LLDSCGARVVATDLSYAAPAAFDGTGVTYRRLDVTDEARRTALAHEIATELADSAPLKGLINNAGITHRARLGETERADWDRVLAVNLHGPIVGLPALL